MATKPSETFTFATDANYSTGVAAGNPTKVNLPGWPNVTEGFIPGEPYACEYRGKLWNVMGDWTVWLDAGSSAGAADAHIVETDSAGKINCVALTATGLVNCQQTPLGLNVTGNATFGSIEVANITTIGKLILSGAGAGIRYRASGTVGATAQDITVASDTWRFTTNPTGTNPVYTIRHTGTVPLDGQRIRVTMTVVSGVTDALFSREDATEIGRIVGGGNGGWLEFEYTAAIGWYCVGAGGDGEFTVPH